MRLFYAAYLAPENMLAYEALIDGLLREVPGALRSIPQQTHHLTLAFLGEIPQNRLAVCVSALSDIERRDAFPIALGRPDILMGRGRPRLVRADVTENADKIDEIQAALLERLSGSLPSIDSRSKPAHVTLARFQKNAHRSQARRVREILRQLPDDSLPQKDRFSSVCLVQSSLTRTGPIYETIAQAELAEEGIGGV